MVINMAPLRDMQRFRGFTNQISGFLAKNIEQTPWTENLDAPLKSDYEETRSVLDTVIMKYSLERQLSHFLLIIGRCTRHISGETII